MAIASSPLRASLVLVTGLSGASGCVDSFSGSNLQLDFSQPTLTAGGTDYDGVRAPADTYFTFYAVDHVYRDEDGDGVPDVDAVGDPIPEVSYHFEIQRFEIRSVIDQTSPCFIEDTGARFPGLHATQVATKLRGVICERLGQGEDCFDNPFEPPPGATDGDVTDVLDADVRLEQLDIKQGAIKVVSSYSTFEYPEVAGGCGAGGDEIPPPECIGDADNEQRLRVCHQLWDDANSADEEFYEGSDKVFTKPLNGQMYGMVEGLNPINNGFLGGATLFVDENLVDADAFTISWQFKDHDGDGEPDYPADFLTDHDESDTGYVFMTGRPEHRVRGVINAHLTNPLSATTFVEVAIFADLGDDGLHF